jgi:hypothetical protein
MKATDYFTTPASWLATLISKRNGLNVLSKPIRPEVQANGRIRHWAFISEVGKYLWVVTELDGQTVHNAFLDRRFKP